MRSPPFPHFSRFSLSLLLGWIGLMASSAAWAKLPAPTDEAKAKAAATAAKTAWTDKVSAYQLCQSMNRVAEGYRKSAKAAGKELQPVVETPACADPGPFVPPETAVSAVAVAAPATPAAQPKK